MNNYPVNQKDAKRSREAQRVVADLLHRGHPVVRVSYLNGRMLFNADPPVSWAWVQDRLMNRQNKRIFGNRR